MKLWVGGYTADMDGHASGISLLDTGDDGSFRALSLSEAGRTDGSPSWIAAHPVHEVVYAALEGDGTVQAFRRTAETTLAPFGAPVAAGGTVCHVAVAPDGGSLVASCWGDGTVARIGLDAAGRPTTPVTAAPAEDPHPAEAAFDLSGLGGVVDPESLLRGHEPAPPPAETEAPEAGEDSAPRTSRAHAAAFLPDGRIATTDLGFDLVRIWRPGTAGLRLDHEVVLPRGCGPRHMVVHPSGHLHVVTEYSCEIFTLAPAPDGRWHLVGGAQVSPAAPLDDAAAELAASHDHAFLYAGLRGSDTIGVLKVRGDGSSLQPTALVETGVRWPRHHVVVRDTLLVTGQLSDEVATYALDGRTGIPGKVRSRIAVPSPSCLLPTR